MRVQVPPSARIDKGIMMKNKIIILTFFALAYSNLQLDSLLTLINQKKYVESIDLADEAIQGKAEAGDVFFKKASEAAFILDEFDKSIEYLKKAISINDSKNYREDWERIVRIRKDIEIALKMYTENAQVAESINEFDALKATYPDCALIHYNVGKIYQQEENYRKAIENFYNAVNINPYREKYVAAINNMVSIFAAEGAEYERMRDFESALDQYLIAYEYVKDFSPLNFKIGKVYYYLKEYEKSSNIIKSLIEFEPTYGDGEAYRLLGNIYKKEGDKEIALQNYLKAIEINEDNAQAYYSAGDIYYSNNKLEQALEYLNKSIEIKKNYSKAYEKIGRVYQAQEDYTKSIYYYETAMQYDRRSYRTLFRLAEVYNQISNYDMAKKYAKDCTRLKRNYFPAYYELGIAEKGLGNRLPAIEAFNMAKKSSDWRNAAQYEIDQLKNELD